MNRIKFLIALINVVFGLTAVGSAFFVWRELSVPIRNAAGETKIAILEIRSNVVQLRAEVKNLPDALKASEQATQATARAIRQARSTLPDILSQVGLTGKAMADLSPQLQKTSGAMRDTAQHFDLIDYFDIIKDTKAVLYAGATSLDVVNPQLLSIGNTLSKESHDIQKPVNDSLDSVATALDLVAVQTDSVRTGVITGLPGVLEELAKSLESYIQPLKTIPRVINACCILLAFFGICFVLIAVKQFSDIYSS